MTHDASSGRRTTGFLSMPEVMVLRGGEVLVGPTAVPWVRLAVQRLVASMRVDGVQDADAEAILRAFTEARDRLGTSAIGSQEVPIERVSASSCAADPITTTEVAEMTNTGTRNVVDLCRRGVFATARKVGGRWTVERDEVLARNERMAG